VPAQRSSRRGGGANCFANRRRTAWGAFFSLSGSAAKGSLTVLQPKRKSPRLAPSAGAPDDVSRIFQEIIASAPASHFQVGDAALVEAYAQAISLARQSAQEIATNGAVIGGRPSPWIHCQEKAHRAISALAMRLRLSPQHRMDSRSAGRSADRPGPSIYALMDEMDDDG
jgi:hypothetical protein